MKLTRKALRKIILEEIAATGAPEGRIAYNALIDTLHAAHNHASRMNQSEVERGVSDSWSGDESQEIASLLTQIWIAAGFDPDEIFKG